jgi:hypothetical protein
MRRIASTMHVAITRADRAAGVWEGETEPSMAVDAHDGEAGVDSWAAQLGQKYDQDAVLMFHPDPEGDSATYSFEKMGELNRDGFLKAMKDAGIPGGRVVDEKLELVGKGRDFHGRVAKLADALDLKYTATIGRMNLIERGDYAAAIKDAERRAREAEAELARGPDQGIGAGDAQVGRKLARPLPRPEGGGGRQAAARAARAAKAHRELGDQAG